MTRACVRRSRLSSRHAQGSVACGCLSDTRRHHAAADWLKPERSGVIPRNFAFASTELRLRRCYRWYFANAGFGGYGFTTPDFFRAGIVRDDVVD